MPADPPLDRSDRHRRFDRHCLQCVAHKARRAVAILIALGSVCAATGCGTVAVAGDASGNQEFVNDVATRLSAATSSAYTAVYALHGGGTGTIIQQPSSGRASYRYRAGLTVITPAGATTCSLGTAPAHKASCRRVPTVEAASPEISRGGLVRPEAVVALLNAAAVDRDSIIAEHDTTIAETSATCVTVTTGGHDKYDACVTASGLLGSFRGASDGVAVDMTLVSYTKTVSPKAFTLPPGAVVTSPPRSD